RLETVAIPFRRAALHRHTGEGADVDPDRRRFLSAPNLISIDDRALARERNAVLRDLDCNLVGGDPQGKGSAAEGRGDARDHAGGGFDAGWTGICMNAGRRVAKIVEASDARATLEADPKDEDDRESACARHASAHLPEQDAMSRVMTIPGNPRASQH